MYVVYILGKGDKSSPTIDEENNFVHCNALHISDAKLYNHISTDAPLIPKPNDPGFGPVAGSLLPLYSS